MGLSASLQQETPSNNESSHWSILPSSSQAVSSSLQSVDLSSTTRLPERSRRLFDRVIGSNWISMESIPRVSPFMAHGDPAFSFLVSNLSSNRPNSIDPALLMCGRDEVPALERCGTSHPVPLNSISVPDDLVCPICFEVAALPVITECSHVFCIRCIISSLAHHFACPLCRAIVNATALEFVMDAAKDPLMLPSSRIQGGNRDASPTPDDLNEMNDFTEDDSSPIENIHSRFVPKKPFFMSKYEFNRRRKKFIIARQLVMLLEKSHVGCARCFWSGPTLHWISHEAVLVDPKIKKQRAHELASKLRQADRDDLTITRNHKDEDHQFSRSVKPPVRDQARWAQLPLSPSIIQHKVPDVLLPLISWLHVRRDWTVSRLVVASHRMENTMGSLGGFVLGEGHVAHAQAVLELTPPLQDDDDAETHNIHQKFVYLSLELFAPSPDSSAPPVALQWRLDRGFPAIRATAALLETFSVESLRPLPVSGGDGSANDVAVSAMVINSVTAANLAGSLVGLDEATLQKTATDAAIETNNAANELVASPFSANGAGRRSNSSQQSESNDSSAVSRLVDWLQRVGGRKYSLVDWNCRVFVSRLRNLLNARLISSQPLARHRSRSIQLENALLSTIPLSTVLEITRGQVSIPGEGNDDSTDAAYDFLDSEQDILEEYRRSLSSLIKSRRGIHHHCLTTNGPINNNDNSSIPELLPVDSSAKSGSLNQNTTSNTLPIARVSQILLCLLPSEDLHRRSLAPVVQAATKAARLSSKLIDVLSLGASPLRAASPLGLDSQLNSSLSPQQQQQQHLSQREINIRFATTPVLLLKLVAADPRVSANSSFQQMLPAGWLSIEFRSDGGLVWHIYPSCPPGLQDCLGGAFSSAEVEIDIARVVSGLRDLDREYDPLEWTGWEFTESLLSKMEVDRQEVSRLIGLSWLQHNS